MIVMVAERKVPVKVSEYDEAVRYTNSLRSMYASEENIRTELYEFIVKPGSLIYNKMPDYKSDEAKKTRRYSLQLAEACAELGMNYTSFLRLTHILRTGDRMGMHSFEINFNNSRNYTTPYAKLEDAIKSGLDVLNNLKISDGSRRRIETQIKSIEGNTLKTLVVQVSDESTRTKARR